MILPPRFDGDDDSTRTADAHVMNFAPTHEEEKTCY